MPERASRAGGALNGESIRVHVRRQTAVFITVIVDMITQRLQSTQRILRIRGYFHHNDGCTKALIARFPAVPLHPSVYEVALLQLKEGGTLTDLQERNRAMAQSVAYCDQPADLSKSPYRWHLRSTDTRFEY